MRISSASYFAKQNPASNGFRSRFAPSDAAASFISRKTSSVKDNNNDRQSLIKNLDKKSTAVSVHAYDNSGLSAEEIHKKKLNAIRAQNSFKSTISDKKEGYLKLTQAKKSDLDEMVKTHFNYNSRDISTMIRQAKTSLSAGKAAIKAKRKVLELRRKIASSSDSDEKEELSAALSHAKSMERAAKKKKHHLESEEMVEHAQENKFGNDTYSEDGTISSAREEIISEAEDVVDEAYDKIDDIESDSAGLLTPADAEVLMEDEAFGEDELFIEDDFVMDMDDLVENVDEAYEILDDVMEDLGMLEAVNPNMSREALEKMKTKHRNSEEKDMVKADMDYMKAMFEKFQESYASFDVCI